jgi:hypothetical protein
MGTITTRFDTTTNSDLLKKGALRKTFDDTMGEAKVEYTNVFNDLKSTEYKPKDQRIAGLTSAQEIVEGQNIPLQSPVLGEQKEYEWRIFGSGFRITEKMEFFNQFGLPKKMARSLAKIMKETKDVEVATLFNNMTSTTYERNVGFDNLAIASAAHTQLPTTLTYSNYGNAELSITSLADARYYFAMLEDDRGVWKGASPTHLVIHPNLYFTAKEILGSDYKPLEQSNTINVLKEMDLKIFEYHRLTGTTCWFMIAKDEDYDFNVFTAWEPDFVIKPAPDNTRDTVATSRQMFTYSYGSVKNLYVGKAS